MVSEPPEGRFEELGSRLHISCVFCTLASQSMYLSVSFNVLQTSKTDASQHG